MNNEQNKNAVSQYPTNTRDMSIKYPKDGEGLTEKQKLFVDIFTRNEGRLTPTECARQAGYKPDRAHVTASELLNPGKYPKVVEAVTKRRIEIDKTNEVKLNKHVNELARLREKAFEDGSYSAAERLRGQAAGLYVERKEIRTGSIDSMSREEVLKALKDIGFEGSFKQENNQTVLSIEDKLED